MRCQALNSATPPLTGLYLTLLEGGRVQPWCAHLPGAEEVAADGWHAQA